MSLKGRIEVESRFRHLERELERGIERALPRGARVAAEAARAAETRRDTGALAGSIQANTTAYRTRSRSGKVLIAVAVVARDFKAIWHEFGTLSKRRRKVSAKTAARRQTPSGQARLARASSSGGIKPLRFLSKGLRAGFPVVMAELQRELNRLR